MQRKIEDIYPLSPTQLGILFHSIYGTNSSVYFHQAVETLPEAIDPEVWRMAWQEVVDRHSILRTAFVWKGSPIRCRSYSPT